MIRLTFILASIFIASGTLAQTGFEQKDSAGDTLRISPQFDLGSAWEYVQQITQDRSLWRSQEDSIQSALIRLLNHTSEPYDSISLYLGGMNFQTIAVSREKVPLTDSLQIRWMNDTTFIIDSVGWSMNLLLKEEVHIRPPVDFSTILFSDTLQDENTLRDTTLSVSDTIIVMTIDTTALEALDIPLHQYSNQKITPPVRDPELNRHAHVTPDLNHVVLTDTIYLWIADQQSPFYSLSGEHQLDSLQSAMETLLTYNERRDSTRLIFNDMYGKRTPFWITTGNSTSQRFWVKNYKNDSITIWIGNPDKNEISLLLEDDIDVNRLMKENGPSAQNTENT